MTDRFAPSRSLVCATLLLAALLPASSFAQTGPELLLAPFPKELRLDANAFAGYRENGHAKNAPGEFRMEIYETQGRVRVNPGDIASPRIGYNLSYLNLDTDIVGLPDRLVDMSVGLAMPIAQQDGWIVGFSIAGGYAGDSFFGDGDAYYGKAAIGVFKQLSATDSLAIAIDYNGNRTFRPDLPLPGFAYIKRIDETLLMTLGIPVTSIEWQPQKNLRLQFSYLLLDDVNARIGYEVVEGFELFAAGGQRSNGYFLDGLPGENKERLLFQQRRAEVGFNFRTKFANVGDPEFDLTVALGYAWNAEFSTGWDQSDSDLLADISDEPYVRFGLSVRF